MQTLRRKNTPQSKNPVPTAKRRRHSLTEVVIALAFFSVYVWMALQMEGLNFDTGFIAVFCTFLSVFVVRCFHAGLTGHLNY